MTIRVTFEYEPEPEERDDADASGLTAEAFEELAERLGSFGPSDYKVERIADR